MTDDEFMQAFFDGRLTSADFGHRGHLRIAWILLIRYPLDAAIDKACDGIANTAARLGAAEKFNRTLSEALMRWMAAALARMNDRSFEDFLEAHPMLVTDLQGLVAQYYSSERLSSSLAKQQFLAPDRQPLP